MAKVVIHSAFVQAGSCCSLQLNRTMSTIFHSCISQLSFSLMLPYRHGSNINGCHIMRSVCIGSYNFFYFLCTHCGIFDIRCSCVLPTDEHGPTRSTLFQARLCHAGQVRPVYIFEKNCRMIIMSCRTSKPTSSQAVQAVVRICLHAMKGLLDDRAPSASCIDSNRINSVT